MAFSPPGILAFILADRWRTAAIGLALALGVAFVGLSLRGAKIDRMHTVLGAERERSAHRAAVIEAHQRAMSELKVQVSRQNAFIDTLALEGNRAALRVARAVEGAQSQRSETTRIIERIRDSAPPAGGDCEAASGALEWGRLRVPVIDSLYRR